MTFDTPDQRFKFVLGDAIARTVALEQALEDKMKEKPELTQEMARALVDAGYISAEEYGRLCADKKWP